MGAVASEAVAVAQAVAGESGWVVLVLFLVLLAVRSKPGRAVGEVVSTEIYYWHRRLHGFSDDELHEWLRDREPESPDST